MAFKAIATNRSKTSTAAKADEDEFQGLWINVGLVTADGEGDDAETKFNRLPRGIAVSDLTEHKVYASTNPEWAAEANLVNALIKKIREKGAQLGEGEAMPLEFSVQLYRRQEQVASVGTPEVEVDLDSLFGA
jgi:hypothetical protein